MSSILSGGFFSFILSFLGGEERAHRIESRTSFEPFDLGFVQCMIQFDRLTFTVSMFDTTFNRLENRQRGIHRYPRSSEEEDDALPRLVLVYSGQPRRVYHLVWSFRNQLDCRRSKPINLVSSSWFLKRNKSELSWSTRRCGWSFYHGYERNSWQ